VRFDSGVESGSEISIFFDPMIAKVIARGATREECVRRMERTLRQTVIFGLTTNQNFLLSVCRVKLRFSFLYYYDYIISYLSVIFVALIAC
jgi:acetyl/propionyl-CoA carboxylase alpha subunit